MHFVLYNNFSLFLYLTNTVPNNIDKLYLTLPLFYINFNIFFFNIVFLYLKWNSFFFDFYRPTHG